MARPKGSTNKAKQAKIKRGYKLVDGVYVQTVDEIAKVKEITAKAKELIAPELIRAEDTKAIEIKKAVDRINYNVLRERVNLKRSNPLAENPHPLGKYK